MIFAYIKLQGQSAVVDNTISLRTSIQIWSFVTLVVALILTLFLGTYPLSAQNLPLEYTFLVGQPANTTSVFVRCKWICQS